MDISVCSVHTSDLSVIEQSDCNLEYSLLLFYYFFELFISCVSKIINLLSFSSILLFITLKCVHEQTKNERFCQCNRKSK